MSSIEETFGQGRVPGARMRDRTIDVESVELEVVAAGPRGTHRRVGARALLAAGISLVVGTAAFFVLDGAGFRTSADAPVAPSARTLAAPLPLPPAAGADSVAAEQRPAEPLVPAAQETLPAHASEVAKAPAKPVRKRSHAKRTRVMSTTSSRTVAKRIQRQ